MRIVLADLKGGDGFVSKDTVAGGYGSRLRPFSKVTRVDLRLEAPLPRPAERASRVPRGAAARAGHEVVPSTASSSTATSRSCCRRSSTTGAKPRGRERCGRAACGSDSSAWRRRSCRSSSRHAPTSSSTASPKRRCMRLVAGETLSGRRRQPGDRRPRRAAVSAVGSARRRGRGAFRVPFAGRPVGGALPLLASRELSGVLHLLSAPDPVDLSVAIGRQHPRRAVAALRATSRGRARRLSRSAVHPGPRRACSRSATASARAG